MQDGAGDDHERWLDEAMDKVRDHASYMKRSFDEGQILKALNYASVMTNELRTSKLSPKNYYELYMSVTDELREMEMSIDDEDSKADRTESTFSVVRLYEKVQHSGSIIPRLYLLITVAAIYIKSKKAPAKDILFDLVELCRGVQHPMRGLFLRNYLSQMSKDKLPDEGTQFEGAGGSVSDSIEFTLQNFGEMNKLWVRMQHQGAMKDRERREKERRNLKQLVGMNLVRLSQMSGVNLETYKEVVLPRILEQIVNCKDAIAQEYLMDCIIQVFPDDFHLQTLETFLTTCGQLHDKVNVKDIIITLMTRLASYAKAQPDSFPDDFDMFPIFHSKSGSIISSTEKIALIDVLSLQVALISFTSKCYPDKIDNIDQVLAFTVQHLEKCDGSAVNAKCSKLIVQLLTFPLDALSLKILNLESFSPLMDYLGDYQKKHVATTIVESILKTHSELDTLEKVNTLFRFVAPLIRDEDQTKVVPDDDRFEFDKEQHLVAQLFQLVKNEDTDLQFKLYAAVRKHFGTGGTQRIEYTLPPLIFGTFTLVRRVQARELDEGVDKPAVKPNKIFSFMHDTITALSAHYPSLSLRLFMQAAQVADKCGFEPVAYEFLTQAFEVYEGEITQNKDQYLAISYMTASLREFKCFGSENFDTLRNKASQHSYKLLKKTDQCRAVYNCSHLFWDDDDEEGENSHRDEKRVLYCLQRSLKIADTCMGLQAHLFVEILNKYLYFYDRKCPSIAVKYLRGLMALIDEHIPTLDTSETSRIAKAHYWNTLEHIRRKAEENGETGELYKAIGVSANSQE